MTLASEMEDRGMAYPGPTADGGHLFVGPPELHRREETIMDTKTKTPEIEIAGKATDAALGKALLAAVQRAEEDDRCTRITSGGSLVAAVVPTSVGEAFYAPLPETPVKLRDKALAAKNGPAQ